jgi:hypothetical protein
MMAEATATPSKSLNPANAKEVTPQAAPARIPMSVPVQRLQVPEIPGYHTHWMRGTPERMQQALQAGYVPVKSEEVAVNYRGLADNPEIGGNTSLGSSVSISAGRADANGQPIRLILMKLPKALWDEDQAAIAAQQDKTAEALRSGSGAIPQGADISNRYQGIQNRNIFTRRT